MPDFEPLSDADLGEWISVAQACLLVPSPTGKRTCAGTIRRWIHAGRLRCRRRGRWRFVCRAEVLALLQPVEPPPGKPPASRPGGTAEAWALEVLRRRGAV